jgi:hypothetical protein
MWPFDIIRKRKYERRRKAALVVLLGTYMSKDLDAAQRGRVETEMSQCFDRSDTPAAGWMKGASWDVIGAYRAAAMERCGIDPATPDLSWSDLFEPWQQLPKWMQWPMLGFDFRPASLVLDFRPMHAATADAKAYLRSHGVDIPEADPQEPPNHSMQPTARSGG